MKDFSKWQKIDQSHALKHIDSNSDSCYFLKVYNPKSSYEEDSTKNSVLNFKYNKTLYPKRKRHIEKARQEFANDLMPVIEFYLKKSATSLSLCFIPTSTSQKDNDYDNRFEDVTRHLLKKFGNRVVFEELVSQIQTQEPFARSGKRRSEHQKQKLKAGWHWHGFKHQPERLLIVDDVIASGMHYKALKELVVQYRGQSADFPIVGIFWAMTQNS